MGLFKKRKPEIIEVEKIVEKDVRIEVEKASRFTFAHSDDIDVVKFYFTNTRNTKAVDLRANSRFVFFCTTYNETKLCYPVFQMPIDIATTRLTSSKRIICVGSIIVDYATSEIVEVNDAFSGVSMMDIMKQLNVLEQFDENSDVTTATDNDIITRESISGEINFDTFAKFITINHGLPWLLR